MKLFLHQAANYTEDQIASGNALLKKIWITVIAITLILVGMMVLFAKLHWNIAIAILSSVVAIAGTYLCSRAEVVLGSFALKAMNGLPNIKIGEVFAAFFKKDVQLPDLDLKKVSDAGLIGVKDVFRAWSYLYMGIGIFAGILIMFKIRNPIGLFIVFSALFVLAARDYAKPGDGEYYLKVAKAVGVAELIFGLVLTFAPEVPFEITARTLGVDVDYVVRGDISKPGFIPVPTEGELAFAVVGEKRLHVVRRNGGVDEYFNQKRTDRGDTSAVWNYPDSPPYVIMLNGVSETLFSDQDQIIRKKGGKIIISPGDKGAHVTFNLCEPTESQFRTGDKSIERTVVTFRFWRPWYAW
ncbi:MAG: hypothetical protein HGB34_03935 [Candidatus Moranbacteria bacterium]|nr:hypothetical protein [Candidatus Moranbacteria bacterium]NTW76025.1 hypothetical protein [Candidatus Moranbacteria bacterium]